MKRILCIILAIGCLFSFAGCSKKDTSSNSDISVDIEYHVKLGEIPECEYKLKDDVKDIEDDFEKRYANDEHFAFNKSEGKKSVCLSMGTQLYYYLKDEADNGVSYIVTYEKAFGFELGTISLEIENALNNYNYKKEALNSENAFFMLGQPEGELIKCEFGDNTVVFVFQDNSLCATAIYNNNSDW